jgi:predicted nucleotidyltransferase
VLKQVIEPIDGDIELAFVYGSIASGRDSSDSDIDLMLVGNDLTYGDVVELLIPAEEQLQREINPTLFTPVEYRNRLNDGQSFLTRIQENPRLMIKGDMYDIGKSGSDKSTQKRST